MYTIITVCFNAADDLEKTILSVLSQKNCEIEYIIKDAASTDHTADVIRKYEKQLRSLKNFVFISEKDSGLYDAMNVATQRATGDKLLFLNSGDLLYDENVLSDVEKQFCDADIVYGNVMQQYQEHQKLITPQKIANEENLGKGMVFCHQAAFIDNALMKEFQYNTEYRICADYDFFLRAIKAGKRFQYFDRTVASFAIGGISYEKAFDLLDESFSIQYSNGVINEKQYRARKMKNQIKRITREILPKSLYRALKNWKLNQTSKKWDKNV